MHARSPNKNVVYGEFLLRGPNSRNEPLRLRWSATESLYYGGQLRVMKGPEGLKTRFERRFTDTSWLKNDPDRVAGSRPFTENFFTTVAVLMAFADAERLMLETIHSPVPDAAAGRTAGNTNYSDIEDFDRERGRDPDPPGRDRISGVIASG